MFEITKEQYEHLLKEGNKVGEALLMGLLSESEICGYGVYDFKLIEENGKYYYDYKTYDNCD